MQGRAFQASDPRESGDGVRLSLLADARPRTCPARVAEGMLCWPGWDPGTPLTGPSAWASHPAPPNLK